MALPVPAELKLTKANLEDPVCDRTQALCLSKKNGKERCQPALYDTNDRIWSLNLQTNGIFFLNRWEGMLGLAPDKLADQPHTPKSPIYPEDLSADLLAATAALEKALAGTPPSYTPEHCTPEHRMRCKNGTHKWILTRGLALRSEAGQVIRIANSSTDISNSQQAQVALQTSENRLKLALETAKAGLWDWQVGNEFVYLSDRYQEMLGYAPGELPPTVDMWREMIHPEDYPWVIERLQNHLRDRSVSYNFEYRLRCKSGEWKWIANYGGVVAYDAQGNPLRMIGIHQDITERKAAEAALNESRQQLHNLIESLPDIIVRLDPALCHLYVSPSLTRITGLSSEAFLGKSHRELGMDETAVNTWEAAANRLLATGEKQVIEFSSPTLEGIRTFEAVLSPEWTKPQAGTSKTEVASILCISRDITERKQTEQQLHNLSKRLSLALQAAKLGVWEGDLDSNQVVWDDRICEIYGIPASNHPRPFSEWDALVHPEDLPRCQVESQRILQDPNTNNGRGEFRVVRPDGSIRHVESYFLIQRDEARRPKQVIGINLDITERKQAEAAQLQAERLQQELQLLEIVLDSVLAGYWDCNLREGKNYWSPGLKRMLGYADDEIPNTLDNWTQFILPEDLPKTKACLERHVQSRGAEPYYNEVRYRHKDGSIVWVICTGQAIEWGESGELLRMVGCHVDITPLKTIEAQLKTSKAHLKEAQRIGNIGSWEFDIQTERITWSDQVFRIFHRDPALGAPKNFAELQQLIHPDDRALHAQAVYTLVDTHQSYDVEFRICRDDGSIGHLQAKGEAVLDETGRLIKLTGIVLDITERKQAEEQRRLLTDRLTLALKAGEIGTWDWDTVHEAFWDDRMYEIYGLQHLPALGQSATYQDWCDCVYPEDLAPTEAALQAAIRGEQEYDVEFRIWRTDGELRWIKANALLQRDAQGNPLRMTGINYNITERKRVEAKLLQKSAQLEASNRELEAFAYSVSHDLRSPLRAIDGFSRALLEDYGHQFDDEGRDYFNRIRHNVQRMGMLIDDLLSLSRVSRLEMRYATVDLSAIAQELLQELQNAEGDRQVECIITPNVTVWADPALMRIVLSNLLQNAWKFTSHHNTARIEFGVIQQPEQPEQPVYFVRDDGAGFDMAYASMLFGVFQRLHNMDEFPGTGIGLATVQRVIHRHGGQVWAEAAIEQGATFYFTLPFHGIEAEP